MIGSGLIPTHAGKTAPRSPRSRPAPAHPHSRGENRPLTSAWFVTLGSSPLTRGKRGDGFAAQPAGGLIPTHAGKTRGRADRLSSLPAHPHSRGENVAVAGTLTLVAGSSPLTRGKLLRRDHRRVLRGLIPTHAGKTRHASGAPSLSWAHPHSRGENSERLCRAGRLRGSSPLTRGKQ